MNNLYNHLIILCLPCLLINININYNKLGTSFYINFSFSNISSSYYAQLDINQTKLLPITFLIFLM